VRAVASAAATGVLYVLWLAVGDRDFNIAVVLLAPALLGAALSMPGIRDRSYLLNALAGSLTIGAVATLSVAGNEQPIFHPTLEFALSTLFAGAGAALFALLAVTVRSLRHPQALVRPDALTARAAGVPTRPTQRPRQQAWQA